MGQACWRRNSLKFDLRDTYRQVELEPAAKRLVTINTHRGLFQYTRLSFGACLPAMPAIFQREIESLLSKCKGVVIYFDNILVTGVTEEEHCKNLEAVLKRLQEASLKLKPGKCSFFQKSIEYLGHIIDADGLQPGPGSRKVKAVLNASVPSNVWESQSYLGLLNLYR